MSYIIVPSNILDIRGTVFFQLIDLTNNQEISNQME